MDNTIFMKQIDECPLSVACALLGIMRKHKITFFYSLVQNIPFSKMKNTDVKCGTSSALFDTTLL